MCELSSAVFARLVQVQTPAMYEWHRLLSVHVVLSQKRGAKQCPLLLHVSEQVGRVYPQAVYFPIRTLYLTLKIEQRERYKSGTSQMGPAGCRGRIHRALHVQTAVDTLLPSAHLQHVDQSYL